VIDQVKAASDQADSPSWVEATPLPFLEVRVKHLSLQPALLGLCVGYESQKWRTKQLVDHMMEWLPEFALSYSERKSFGADTAVRLIRAAARSIYASQKFQNRGEFGELLLHIAIRQVFQTVPAISKIYYKDSDNTTVKGFDAVHVVVSDSTLELWIGESKLYNEISRAIADVVSELQLHTEDSYLRREFAAIVNKIDPRWPHATRLKQLLDPTVSLDKIFDLACIPVLLTYDSEAVNAHVKVTNEYVKAFTSEVERHYVTFKSKSLPKIRIYLFLMPLKNKSELVLALDTELKKWQQI
jgi:Cap4 SAVED domain